MTVGIVGLGYVGLPLAVAFAEAGHDVVAVDSDPTKIEAILAGRSYIEDLTDERVAATLDRLSPTASYAGLAEAQAVLICVPTPLSRNREPDLTALLAAAGGILGILQAGQLIVLESTTYPGTTRERLAPVLESGGLAAGTDFYLAFSPERVDPGRTDWTLRTTPKVVGGLTPACADRAAQLYGEVCDEIVVVSSPDVAELSKLLENIFRSVNIALVNELSLLCERMEIDIWEVIGAASTKPYGFMRFEPGPGTGGHCLPVDPFYLAWRAREFDMSTKFIELAGEINQTMPYHCVQRVEHTLNTVGKAMRGARVGLVGVSYKGGVGDIRESPAIKIIDLLHGLGAEVLFHDPHVPELSAQGLTCTGLEELAGGVDIAVIVTAHPSVDHDLVATQAPLLVDLRGVMHQPLIRRVRT